MSTPDYSDVMQHMQTISALADTARSVVAGLCMERNRLLDTLRAIEAIGGNLPDEDLTTRTGPNDAVARGIMVTTARSLARAALSANLAPPPHHAAGSQPSAWPMPMTFDQWKAVASLVQCVTDRVQPWRFAPEVVAGAGYNPLVYAADYDDLTRALDAARKVVLPAATDWPNPPAPLPLRSKEGA